MNLADHLDKLKAFKVIAESRTMREAADRLNVTQPSLTKLIQTLEASAGAPLLVRGRNGVTPTEAGKILAAYAASTLKELADVEQKLSNPSDRMSGHLRIGAYASLAEYLWPDFIPAIKKKAPALRLSVLTSEAIAHSRALESGEIDILVEAEPRIQGDLISWSLYEDRFNFHMNVAQKWTPETIGSLPLIYSPNAFDRENKKIAQHLEEKGYTFKERIELDSFMAVLAFARKGIGLAVLPNRLAEAGLREGQLFVASLKNFPAKGFGAHTFAATILENRKDDPRLQFLLKSLRQWYRKEPGPEFHYSCL